MKLLNENSETSIKAKAVKPKKSTKEERKKEFRLNEKRKGVRESRESIPKALKEEGYDLQVHSNTAFSILSRPSTPIKSLKEGRTIFLNGGIDKNFFNRTPDDKLTELLKASMDENTGTVLSGKVTGYREMRLDNKKKYGVLVETTGDIEGATPRVITILLNEFFIPFSGENRNPVTEDSAYDEIQKYISERIGAEIEFMIVMMDRENYETGWVLGSRKKAAEKRIQTYWYGHVKESESGKKVNLFRTGQRVMTRVVSAKKQYITCEIFGIEFPIYNKELGWHYIVDSREYFYPGMQIPVILTLVDRSTKNEIFIEASHKEAIDNPVEKYIKQYCVGDTITATVTNVLFDEETSRLKAFVNVGGKFDMQCWLLKGIDARMKPVRGDKVQVAIRGSDPETFRTWGEIIHVFR